MIFKREKRVYRGGDPPPAKFKVGWVVCRRNESIFMKITARHWNEPAKCWEYCFLRAPHNAVMGWHEQRQLRALTPHEAGSILLGFRGIPAVTK